VANIVKLPSAGRQKQQGAGSTADERHQRRMAWADSVLEQHIQAINNATTIEDCFLRQLGHLLVTNDKETKTIEALSHSRHSKLHSGHKNQ
jgi:hypothetical protein